MLTVRRKESDIGHTFRKEPDHGLIWAHTPEEDEGRYLPV